MSVPVPDNKAAVEFLRAWSRDGPWVLTSIRADRKAIDTQTFHPSTVKAMRSWLREYNGQRNVYFHVNPPLKDITKKAEREDIKEVSWLHVDIDPRAGEDIEEEQTRSLALLTTKLPEGVPPPTCIVFSGGGYQGFWKLNEPIPVNGDLALAEDAKRYNQQLEILFGADNCHNIDRIMRLPGTINLPDERKRKKGRVPTLATLHHMQLEQVYNVEDFNPAPVVQMKDERGFSGHDSVKISGNIERLDSVDELNQWDVPDRVKIVIVQGRHPEETKDGDNSRSAWLFDVICNLLRCNVPDEVVFSVITDKEFGISESVLDKGANAERYALRQISRGKEEAIDPWLREMNERHIVIGNMGGKCRIVEEQMDHSLGRTRITRQSFEDIRNRYMHQRVKIGEDDQGKAITKQVGHWWLSHPKRRQYDSMVFAPGHDVSGSYNLWKGFACTSQPGDWSLLLEHMRSNICQGREDLLQYLLGWMARTVQKPDRPGEVAVVLRGGRGVGKGFFATEFGKLFGRHFLHISNPSHLVGNFNSHLRDCILLFADEAFYAGDKKHASILKTIITEETISIEAKGIDVEAAPNYIHLMMASNDQHVIPAGGDERRFLVLDVGKGSQQNSPYFAAISEQMDGGGREGLLHFLMAMDLTDYRVRTVPSTDALHEQKLLSLGAEEEWWYQKLEEGRILANSDRWHTEVMKDALVDDYIEYTRRFNVSRRGNQTALGKFLRRMCPKMTSTQRQAMVEVQHRDGWSSKVERRVYFFNLSNLETARAKWEELYGREDWLPAAVQEELSNDDEREPF